MTLVHPTINRIKVMTMVHFYALVLRNLFPVLSGCTPDTIYRPRMGCRLNLHQLTISKAQLNKIIVLVLGIGLGSMYETFWLKLGHCAHHLEKYQDMLKIS